MGAGCTRALTKDDMAAKRKTKAIDDDLETDFKKERRIFKLLFLGTGESGKSTFFRQMQICHGAKFTEAELKTYVPIVYSNTLSCMRTLIKQSKRLGEKLEECRYSSDVQQEVDFFSTIEENQSVTQEIADAITTLWRDEGIRNTWESRSKFQIFDSALYFFDHVQDFTPDDYVPKITDMLRCRVRTTGIIEQHFQIGEVNFHVFDVGGQRNERKKWIHCFEHVTAVIFVCAISEYDQVLIEDGLTNRMKESLVIFDEVINNRWFSNTDIILFLNKKDLLMKKCQNVPLNTCFEDYYGDNSYDSCTEFIQKKFEACSRMEGKQIYTHITCAMDDTPQLKLLFQSVKNIIVQNSLKEGGLI